MSKRKLSATSESKTEETSSDFASVLQRVLDVAKVASRAAGQIIKTNCGSVGVEKTKSRAQDLCTKTDTECQQLISDHVTRHFPTHGFLGEESVISEQDDQALDSLLGKDSDGTGKRAKGTAEWLWVVDPLDGTTNFVHGVPASVVSIGVAHKGVPVVGVIYDPYDDEMYSAVKGCGAFLNDKPMHVDSIRSLSEALIAFGSAGGNAATTEPSFRAGAKFNAVGRGTRNIGSAALHIAYVAAGRYSAFFQIGLHAWDMLAGVVLITEAGGKVTDTRDGAYTLRTRDIVVSDGTLHDEVLRVLKETGCNLYHSEYK